MGEFPNLQALFSAQYRPVFVNAELTVKIALDCFGFKGKPLGLSLNRAVSAVFVTLLAGGASAQARFSPPPAQVVVPQSVFAAAGGAELRAAERAWRANPRDEATALRYARAVFVLGLSEGDLRWYGAAKAAIQPWWDAPRLSAEGHYLRALVRQGFHDFAGGLRDLDAAIALDPAPAEYWSWRFSLHLLTTQLDRARADCAAITQRLGADEGSACEATLAYRTGRAAEAVPRWARLVALPDYQGGLTQDWLRYHQGMTLAAAGRVDEALAVWRAHLQRRPRAHLVRLSLAEWLNATGRAAEALAVSTVDALPSDSLLVQALIAARALGDPRAATWQAQIAQRLDASDRRGDTLIERSQLMFLIRAGHDVARGLALAEASWAEQQEPADAVLLAEAALSLKRPQAGRPVLEWMRATGYTDPLLAPLAERLRAGSGS